MPRLAIAPHGLFLFTPWDVYCKGQRIRTANGPLWEVAGGTAPRTPPFSPALAFPHDQLLRVPLSPPALPPPAPAPTAITPSTSRRAAMVACGILDDALPAVLRPAPRYEPFLAQTPPRSKWGHRHAICAGNTALRPGHPWCVIQRRSHVHALVLARPIFCSPTFPILPLYPSLRHKVALVLPVGHWPAPEDPYWSTASGWARQSCSAQSPRDWPFSKQLPKHPLWHPQS